MKNNYLQIIGWLGMVMILSAYFLMTFSFIESQSTIYQVLNVVGALGIVIETCSKKDYQPMVLNIVWIGIALVAIIRNFLYI